MRVDLECRENGHDKVYVAEVVPVDTGFVVKVQWGRRGSALQAGTKTPRPVPEPEALKIFERLVAEKTGKGYVPMAGTAPSMQAPGSNRLTDAVPLMLLEPISDDRAIHYVNDVRWVAEPKFDGKRIALHVREGQVIAQNRLQIECSLHDAVAVEARAQFPLIKTLVLDGELVNGVYYAFDLLDLNGSQREVAYVLRRKQLEVLFAGRDPTKGALRLGHFVAGAAAKTALLERLRAERAEGAVFKRLDQPYKAGRNPDVAVKLKFWEDCTVRVIAHNETGDRLNTSKVDAKKAKSGKRSVQMCAVGPAGEVVNVGDVSIPVNHEVPALGALINVRYLYAQPSHKLFQPIYQGVRDDKDTPDTLASLKYKAGEDEDAE